MGLKHIFAYFSVITIILISSCTTTKFVVDVEKPAVIEIPDNINRIVIENRCLKPEYDSIDRIVEGLVDGYGPVINQAGSKKAVEAVTGDLIYAPNLEPVYVSNVPAVDSLTDKFPKYLSWENVNNICDMYKADALLSLEVFNTATKIDYGFVQRREKKDDVKVWSNTKVYNVKMNSFPIARLTIEIVTGWRLYYPLTTEVVVEEKKTYIEKWEAEGKTRKEARRNLPAKMFSVEAAGKIAGMDFSNGLYPKRITVERNFFIRYSKDFRTVNHYLKQRYWQKAASIWKKHTNSENKKVASAALYNLAVINEMNGYTGKALDLAVRALKLNNDKVISEYIKLLKNKQ